MKKRAAELTFISQIKRDGSGVLPVSESMLEAFKNNPFSRDEVFVLTRLSITEGTYIASGFNTFVVKI